MTITKEDGNEPTEKKDERETSNEEAEGKESNRGKEERESMKLIKVGGGKDDDSHLVSELSDVTAFEDILQFVGTHSRWNFIIVIICSMCTFLSAFQTLSYQFLGATPDHWCRVGPLIEANWTQEEILSFAIPFNNKTGRHERCEMYKFDYEEVANLGYEGSLAAGLTPIPGNTSILPCYSREFNLTQYESTVTTEWDLVCERRALYSTTQAAVPAGALVGYFICGYLLDRFGRRPIVLCCSLFFSIFAFLISFSTSIEVFIFLKAATITMDATVYMGSFVIIMETCSTKKRSRVGVLFLLPWTLGYMMMPGVAFLVRRWRWLQFVFSLPTIFFILSYWFLPESPRWLILQGRYEETLQILRWGARVNCRELPPDQEMLVLMEKIREEKPNGDERVQKTLSKRALDIMRRIVALFSNRELRKRALIVFICFFASSLIYYGVSLNSTNISTNLYIYTFFGGLMEVPSYLFLWLAIVLLGRVKTLSSLYFVCAFSILVLTTFIVFLPDAPKAVVMVLSLCGKMAITAAFHLVWMISAELFPTEFRSMAVGQGNVMSKFGAICSPYINDILGDLVMWAPSALFGLTSLVVACFSLLLPETGKRNLDIKNKPEEEGRVSPK